MKSHTFNISPFSGRYWYLSLILGILFIFIGIVVLRTPKESYITLSIFFSLSFFINGILEIIYYLSNRSTTHNWGWGLVSGIFDLFFGSWLISNPQISIEILPIYVGFMLMFRSLTAVAVAIELKNHIAGEWIWLSALGILGTIFSFVMIWNPLLGGMTIIYWTAWAFISIGIFRILFSFKLKNFRNHKLSNDPV